MANTNNLDDIIQSILDGIHTNADRETLRHLLKNGDRETILQLGKYNINIGDGKDIHIGDRIYQQWDDLAIQAVIKAIQKVNWRCVASLTENDYTQGDLQSTGIGIIDKLAKQLTDFSQQHLMSYGLKLAFSPNRDREYFISGGDQLIKFWEPGTLRIFQEFFVPENSALSFNDLWFTSVAISRDGQLIAASKHYQVKIWRMGTESPLHIFNKTFLSNFFDLFGFDSVTFSPDGKLLVANDNQDIKIWDVESGREIAKLSGHSDKVTCVVFNPSDRRILASCSYDKTIKLWDIESNRCLGTLSEHRDAVYTIAFSPDGEIMASGSHDNTIQLWNLSTGELPQPLRQHSEAVTCLVFSPDGKTLVSGSNDGKIIEWDVATQEVVTLLPEQHRRGVTSIAISSNGEILISGGRDRTIKVWRRQD
jgi:WD40 repeat protein